MKNTSKSFEENMQRLEQIVRAMEQGEVSLDESLKLFQEGTELVRTCSKMLDEAQLQVKKLTISGDGSLVEEDMEVEL
jgi:exodeoxyribonuclease VII small subunit